MEGYPYGLDYGWLACDMVGQVALFSNAGAGPIPASVIAARPASDKAEELTEQLPMRGDIKTFADRHLQCFAQIANRGCYSYDWQDVTRPFFRLNCYELMECPSLPVL